MEALLIVAFSIVLAVIAPRFGRDSRDQMASDEERLSRQGFVW
jgi:hypothetical protein